MDGAIAGWLSFSEFIPRCAYHITSELSVYVHTDFWRRGVGARLLGAALERAPSLGFITLLGLIFAHNAASLRLFEKFGFARWGHLPRVAQLDGVERDLVIVGRHLA